MNAEKPSRFSVQALKNAIESLTGGKMAKFGREAHMPRSSLNSWITGQSQPAGANLIKLSNFTGQSVSYFCPNSKTPGTVPDPVWLPDSEAAEIFPFFKDVIETVKTHDPRITREIDRGQKGTKIEGR